MNMCANVCSWTHLDCVCDMRLSNPSLNPLILPLGAQLSVNNGSESEEREWRSGLTFTPLQNLEEISESFTKHNSFKMFYSPKTNGLKHNSCSQRVTL